MERDIEPAFRWPGIGGGLAFNLDVTSVEEGCNAEGAARSSFAFLAMAQGD